MLRIFYVTPKPTNEIFKMFQSCRAYDPSGREEDD